mgnify:FL=1
MKLETWQRDRNERCMERHQLSIERLQMIDQEETVQDRYRPYFRMCAAFFAQTGITSQNNRRPQF